MQYTFQFPHYATGSDGARRQVGESEMMAEVEGSRDDWYVVALYAWEFITGGDRFEIKPNSPEYREARNYLYGNPQERDLIAVQLEEDDPAGTRSRQSVVSEDSTLWGRP